MSNETNYIAESIYPCARIAKFEKVSREQFKKDVLDCMKNIFNTEERIAVIDDIYDAIKLPVRATKGSAGYDFFTPFSFKLIPGKGMIIPTGIKCYMEPGWALQMYPRSGQGFKYGIHMYNTTSIIDQDYYNNKKNEGHIMTKLSCKDECDIIEQGTAYCQGIFVQYGITVDDEITTIREGGIGSTSVNNNNN